MANILIGENVPDINTALTRLFRRAGHHVDSTTTGQDTLTAALQDPPDLLIMNPALPDFDGLHVCRVLRAEPNTATVPIIVLSVNQQPGQKQDALDAGADDYIGKPFDIHHILDRGHALISGTGQQPDLSGSPAQP